MESPQISDQRVVGPEVGVVVQLTDERRRVLHEPFGTGTPGMDVHRTAAIDGEPLRAGPQGRPGRAPDCIRAELHGWVSRAPAQRLQSQAQIERAAHPEGAGCRHRHDPARLGH